jgi:glycosyltransferase involved in cell wall biosynthesis
MKLAVIIPTCGRKPLLPRLIAHLQRQTRKPDIVLISAPDVTQAEITETTAFKVVYLFGKQGLTAQRNVGLIYALTIYDIVVFFDDDFLPADDYLAEVEKAFETRPDWAGLTGNVIHDGIGGKGLSFEEGLQILDEQKPSASECQTASDELSTYGCNMAFRSASIGDLRFDERLPLYGWQEDVDFSTQVGRRGRIVRLSALRGVHLGVKSGRQSGVRLGYSQIVNPLYLMHKGTVPRSKAITLMARNVAANLMRSMWPEPYIDRRGRLWGNLLAASDVLKRRIEPEHILNL